MIKISGAYNQLTRILSWRGWRKSDETLPEARPDETDTTDHSTQQQPKRKKSSLRRLTKIIHKRKTKDSVSKEKLVTAVDHGSSDEKMTVVSETQQIIPVACQARLNTKDDTDEGACAKSASNAEFEVLNLGAAFASNQDEWDDADSLLNSSGAVNSFYLDLAFRQPLNTSIEVLEEVHTLLTDIARINRNSQVTTRVTIP